MASLAKILVCIEGDTGQGVLTVKRGLERAFLDRSKYDTVFGSKQKVKWRFKRFYLAYRLFRFLSKQGYPSESRRKQRHGFMHSLWVAHMMLAMAKGIPENCSIESICSGFDEFESQSLIGRRAKKVIKQLTVNVWRAFRKGRTKDREHWTANNFFKDKYGSICVKRFVVPRMRKEIRELAKYLLK